ncbi:MAG TPA: ribosome maturation factor RimM [Oleiagrimonas sp.]|nr:ribosome maturation factor RimM [Oleiagrimonas sp.]
MSTTDRRVPVGRIVGVFGVSGEVKLESWTEPRERIFEYQPWQLDTAPGKSSEVDGVHGRKQGKGLVARLPDVDDRDAAAALVGSDISVVREQLPEPARGEFYWADLEGLQVVTMDGVALGQVSHVVATGANDVLVVRDGSRERMLPFVMEKYIKDVDMETGRIVIDWDPDF